MRFEHEEDNPGGLEIDEFDARSRHCLILHRKTEQFAGCVRLVLADPQDPDAPFPFEKFCGHSIRRNVIDPRSLPRHKIGEISRLAVISAFRKRSGETNKSYGIAAHKATPDEADRRHFPSIPLGLYLAITAVGLLEDLEGVFAMMEPRLARHLRHVGIEFSQAGPVVEYHGPRAPYYISRESLFATLKPEIHALLQAIQADLAPSLAD